MCLDDEEEPVPYVRTVSAEAFMQLLELISNPPEPNEKLKALFKEEAPWEKSND